MSDESTTNPYYSDDDNRDRVLDHLNLPDDAAMVTARLVVLAYVREDGTTGYGVHTKGEAPMTTYLGLLVVAQQEVLGWGSTDG